MMVDIRATATTTLPPERVIAAATDFSDRRPRIWTNLDPDRYRVLAIEGNTAEVVEGSSDFGGIWAREGYDWSRPWTVRSEVLESNVFGPGSWWELSVEPTDGGTSVRCSAHRRPVGVRGWLLVSVLRIVGDRLITRYLRSTLAGLERESATSA
jgi:hypothetical protein